MGYLLNVIYLILLIAASPWLFWRYLRWGKNRRGWSQKLLGWVPRRESDRPCIWFHAVSVGEVNLLAPLITRLQQQRADIEIVISTTTETGYDLAQKKFNDHCAFFFPFDFTWAVRNAIRRVRPSLIVLAELEIWPNFIRTASSFGVPPSGGEAPVSPAKLPIAVINGRLSESSFSGYRKLGPMLRSSFRRLDMIAVQNKDYSDRFKALGCRSENVIVSGSVKFDGVQTDRQNEKSEHLAQLAGIQPDEFVWLAGSTQVEEDLLIAKVYQQLMVQQSRLRLILAPRHPERVPRLVRSLNELNLPTVRRSALDSSPPHPLTSSSPHPSILIIDVIGELGAWWGVADAAYVGGSMGPRGGQNMIEPAAYGVPVSFGPNTQNFQEIVSQLLQAEAATVVHNAAELSEFVQRVMRDREWADRTGASAQQVVQQHTGASDRTVELLLKLVSHTLPAEVTSLACRTDQAA